MLLADAHDRRAHLRAGRSCSTSASRSAAQAPTTLRAKLWRAGTTEPAGWQLTATDSTASLQAAGAIGFESYISASATNAPVTVSLDNYTASTIGAPPAPNQAPVAVFPMPTPTGQSVSVDGSGSSDPDGSIASYSWNWGDGTPNGSGATASHVYTSGGDKTITLTVTDNLGATASLARNVTVTAPPGPVPAGQRHLHAHGRPAAGEPASSAVRGRCRRPRTPRSNGSAASVVHAAGATPPRDAQQRLCRRRRSHRTGRLRQGAPRPGTSSPDSSPGRSARPTTTRPAPACCPAAPSPCSSPADPTSVLLANATVAGLTYAPGDVLNIRFQVIGTGTTTLRAKLWRAGTAEPAAWQLTATDTTAAAPERRRDRVRELHLRIGHQRARHRHPRQLPRQLRWCDDARAPR